MPKPKLIIAIDGGAGTGTSTAAKGAAKALGIPHLNTGELYRGITHAVLKGGFKPSDEAACVKVAQTIKFDLDVGNVVAVNGARVQGSLHEEPVNSNVSEVASFLGVRDAILDFQRSYGAKNGAVMEGRDIGTRVFPDAPLKYFFVCDPEERVKRVNAGGRGHETVETLLERDRLDASRKKIGAFVKADDAIILDTTNLTADQVIQRLVDDARELGY